MRPVAEGEFLRKAVLRKVVATHPCGNIDSSTGEGQLHHANNGPDYVEESAGVKAIELRLLNGRLEGSA